MSPSKRGYGYRAVLGHIFVRGWEIKPFSPYKLSHSLMFKTCVPKPLKVYSNARFFGCSIYKAQEIISIKIKISEILNHCSKVSCFKA